MASIDGGHYFLTVLAPIRNVAVGGTVDQESAPMIRLRDLLAKMPTAMQTPASTASGTVSAFARSDKTHFARLSIVSQLGFNGTQARDPILTSLKWAEPRTRHDDLNNHYLMFAAEFDAPSGSREADRASYLRELWDVMSHELNDIFCHCVGFEEVTTASEFIDYIKRCEIETTMPFNLYWAHTPTLPSLSAKGLAARVVLAGLAGGVGLWALLRLVVEAPQWLAIIAGIVLAVIAMVWALGSALRNAGDKPFPSSPDGDLPTVLKSMYIQQKLSDFSMRHQSAEPEVLHAMFGEFLKEVQPDQPHPRHPAGKVYADPTSAEENA